MQMPNDKRRRNQRHRNSNHGGIPLGVTRRLNLLPYKQRQPGLDHVCEFVHARGDQGPLLVVSSADLVRPGEEQAANPPAEAMHQETRPFQPVGDVPDRQTDVYEYVDKARENNRRPPRTAKDGIRAPCIEQRRDNRDSGCDGGDRVDIRDAVTLLFEPQLESYGACAGSVVEKDIEGCKEVDMPAGEYALHLGPRKRTAVGSALELHALLCYSHILGSEVPGRSDFGEVRKQVEARNGDRQRDEGVDYEEPLPPAEPVDFAEVVHSSHEVAREHGAKGVAGMEDTGPLG